jgi:hypothetical protein
LKRACAEDRQKQHLAKPNPLGLVGMFLAEPFAAYFRGCRFPAQLGGLAPVVFEVPGATIHGRSTGNSACKLLRSSSLPVTTYQSAIFPPVAFGPQAGLGQSKNAPCESLPGLQPGAPQSGQAIFPLV